MTVTATAQAAGQQTLAAAAASTSTSGADFNMFLRLLTTQMQNQDPLDPMKTSEYTQQLAQYSQIEQTVQQSGTLRDILASLSTQDLSQASALIGRDVGFDTAVAGLTAAGPATWDFTASQAPASLVATISDAAGRPVATRTIDPALSGPFSWDGATASGAKAAPGSYTLSIAAVDSSGTTVPVTITATGRVDSVTAAGGSVLLGVNGILHPVKLLTRVAAAG